MFYSNHELKQVGFKSLGRDVKISSKASIYNPELMEIGDHSRIDDFCVVSGKVEIGRNVHIAALCLIGGGTEGIEFADFSAIAYGSYVFTQNDDYLGYALHNPTVPVEFRKEYRALVYIGQHVLIGTNCVICPGVRIADGCSVGAKSLVNKSTEPCGVYFGIPAKRKREREQGYLQKAAEYLASGN